MSKIDKKKDKREYQKVKEEWIQMQDLNEPKNQELNKKFAIEGIQYQQQKLKREAQQRQYRLKQSEVLKQKQQILQKQKSEEIEYPYKIKRVIKKQYKSKNNKKRNQLCRCEVTCDFCTVPQSVPGNTQLYICGSCQNMNQSYPLYGIVTCGCCQSKVGFGFGMSEYIKCPQCESLNKVPLQAPKNYEAVVAPSLKQNRQPRRRENQRQRYREQDFMYEGFQREKKQSQDLI